MIKTELVIKEELNAPSGFIFRIIVEVALKALANTAPTKILGFEEIMGCLSKGVEVNDNLRKGFVLGDGKGDNQQYIIRITDDGPYDDEGLPARIQTALENICRRKTHIVDDGEKIFTIEHTVSTDGCFFKFVELTEKTEPKGE